ncbi:MAG: hypothetical protein INQ03_03880 [Candidatus Heimdallarchaeota archaeon]|nr:hypothetical protein [Candidatus Heimdallarchaeota archaeon]
MSFFTLLYAIWDIHLYGLYEPYIFLTGLRLGFFIITLSILFLIDKVALKVTFETLSLGYLLIFSSIMSILRQFSNTPLVLTLLYEFLFILAIIVLFPLSGKGQIIVSMFHVVIFMVYLISGSIELVMYEIIGAYVFMILIISVYSMQSQRLLGYLTLVVEQRSELRKEVDQLHILLPICCSCKKIRDESDQWVSVETYISSTSDVDFTHSYCDVCTKKIIDSLD